MKVIVKQITADISVLVFYDVTYNCLHCPNLVASQSRVNRIPIKTPCPTCLLDFIPVKEWVLFAEMIFETVV
jgi:hypothetical protein